MKKQGANSCIKYLGLNIPYYEKNLGSNFHQKQKTKTKTKTKQNKKGFNTKITCFLIFAKSSS